MKTLFEKIIDNELAAEKVYADDSVVVIKDKFPRAPVHLLIITRKPFPNIHSLQEEDFGLMANVFRVASLLVKQFSLEKNGYRIVVNSGPYAGQEIMHLHFHLLGGAPLDANG